MEVDELQGDSPSGASSLEEMPLIGGPTKNELYDAAQEFASSVEELYRVADAFLGRHAKDRPYTVLGAAAGVGFVLGGGLAWRLAGTFVNAAGRIAMTRAIENFLQSNSDSSRTTSEAVPRLRTHENQETRTTP